MSEILLESLRWGGSYFLEGGSRKGGFGRTPRTPPGYGPAVGRPIFNRYAATGVEKTANDLASSIVQTFHLR